MEALSVYIPVDRRIALNKGEELPDRTEGAVLFADISGFTALTEVLVQKLGPQRGAEELTQQLNSIYETLINQIHRYLGSVVSFSGDAITCWFDGDDGRRATTCALAMQKAMAPLKEVKTAVETTVSFSIKASVTAGPSRRFLVGDPRVRFIEALAGKLLDRVATAEKLAGQGEVLVGAEIIKNLHAEENVIEWRTGKDGEQYAVIASLKDPAPETPWENIPVISSEQSREWLLPAIYERLIQGGGEFLAELRPVAALFLKFTGINYDDDNANSLLDAYIRWVQGVLARYEGNLLELTIGDKGSNLYITFGALQAHEDDAARAAGAALELLNIPAELKYINPPQIGISLGQMRTGSYGSQTRRSYAAQGSQVNVANRLMSKAESGQILTTQVVADTASRKYKFEYLDTFPLKGVSQPVPVFALRGQLQQQAAMETLHKHAQSTMVGRQKEREFLANQMDALRNREEIPLIFIQGEAGIGKSRLVADLVEVAEENGISYWVGVGDAIEKSTPYLAWRPIFARYFGLDGLSENARVDEYEEVHQQFMARLAEVDPSLVPMAPLLNIVLPIEIPDNEHTISLSGDVRANQTHDLCITLLKHATAKKPHVLVMEDAHWFDSASWTLLRLISRDVPSLLVVIVMRPVHESAPPDLVRMLASPNIAKLSLDTLSPEEIETLICYRLGVNSLPQEVARFIRNRAEGHPFFSEELAYALRDRGLIFVSDGICQLAAEAVDLNKLDFPDTIEGVIISRIDKLPTQEQLLLKVASVIGRIFALRILSDIYPIESDKSKLPEYLSHTQNLDITPQETPEPDLAYIFKHIITQEVTYNLLLFAQRRELHQIVAQWFERTRADDLHSFYSLLVHHWQMAENSSKTIEYLGKAGEQAASLGANQEAINFLTRALELNQKGKYITDRMVLADWEHKIGYAYLSIGFIEDSINHFRAALGYLGRRVPDSQAGYTFGLLAGMIRQTFHRLWSSRFVGRSKEPEVCLKASHIFQDMGVAVYHTSNPIAAMYVTIFQLNEAERATPSGLAAAGYAATAVLAAFFSPYKLATVYVELAKKAMTSGSRQESGYATELLSMYNLGIGHWKEAEIQAVEAYQVYANTGNFRRWEELTSIYSSTLLPQGQVERALELRRELEQLSLRGENPQSMVWAIVQQAEIAMRQDRLGDAIPLLERASTLIDKIGSADQVWTYGVLAKARLWNGQTELAQQAASLSQALILKTMPNAFYALEGYVGVAEVGITLWDINLANKKAASKAAHDSLKGLNQFATFFPIGKPRAHLWEGMYQWKLGNHSKAHRLWHKGLTLAQNNQFIYEEGLLRRVIATHLESNNPERNIHLKRAVELLSSIGASHDAKLAQSAIGS